jgi:DNA-binding NtrC family response regulator
MQPPKILLLEFCPTRGLSESLCVILNSSGIIKLIHCELPENGDLTAFDKSLSAAKSEFSPNLTFLLLSPSLVARACPLLQYTKREISDGAIAVVVETDEAMVLLELVRSGADEFFVPPLRALDVLPRVCRLLERSEPNGALLETLKRKLGLKQLIGESTLFLEQMEKIPLVAKFNTNVLILGETGTGKELCARAIHYLSPRSSKTFMPINCGAIPVDLVENELFGHVRGAFTGAATSRKGLIEEAEGGSLFLDEVDCLPLLAQVKLLRFLQEKEFRPLGSTKMRQADVRVIAAANSNLEEAVKTGRLREDLFYRLNIVPLMLPSLRERTEDIPLLARHFLRRYEVEFDKELTGFSPEAMHLLLVHSWPGNIRELEHVIERAVVLGKGPVIQREDLVLSRSETIGRQSLRQAKAKMVEAFEKTYIQGLLVAYQGNITRAAEAAQKNRRAFWQLIRRHHIDVQTFKSKAS